MDTLVLIYNRKEPRADSRLLAERLGINHKSLINQIRSYKADFQEFGFLPFKKAKIDGKGRPQNITYLNENQSILLLTYSKNTSKVRELKKQLVKAFSIARKQLETRQDGKQSRLVAMNSVKLLVNQAEMQGSSSPNSYYMNITKLTYGSLFGSGKIERDKMTREQLSFLNTSEVIIQRKINALLQENPNIYYKDIYRGVKDSLKAFATSISVEH